MNTTNIRSSDIDKFEEKSANKSSIRLFLKKRDERLFQVMFILSFPIFLAVVCATRFLPLSSDNKKHTSMLSEARESAHSTIALALAD
jgi:hypothetical protein